MVNQKIGRSTIIKFALGDWVSASSATTKGMDKKVNEPIELNFYGKFIVQFTYNKPGKQSKTYLIGIIYQVPTEDILLQWKSVIVMFAPPGIKIVPDIDLISDNLKLMNWKQVNVGVAPQIQLEHLLNIFSIYAAYHHDIHIHLTNTNFEDTHILIFFEMFCDMYIFFMILT